MRPNDREMGNFDELRRIVATLRSPEGCPWDRVQTHLSLRTFLLEEAAETLEALDEQDPEHLQEELGDLLLQILLHIQIAEEIGQFTLGDVVGGIARKLVRRHPHVFGEAVVHTPEAVVRQWDEIKQEERGELESVLLGIPPALPALARAQAIQRRTARAGFTWQSTGEVWDALAEELEELRRAETPEERRQEIGDSLFALANLARQMDADAEESLRSASSRFRDRFTRMERQLREEGRRLPDMTMEEKLSAWRATRDDG